MVHPVKDGVCLDCDRRQFEIKEGIYCSPENVESMVSSMNKRWNSWKDADYMRCRDYLVAEINEA